MEVHYAWDRCPTVESRFYFMELKPWRLTTQHHSTFYCCYMYCASLLPWMKNTHYWYLELIQTLLSSLWSLLYFSFFWMSHKCSHQAPSSSLPSCQGSVSHIQQWQDNQLSQDHYWLTEESQENRNLILHSSLSADETPSFQPLWKINLISKEKEKITLLSVLGHFTGKSKKTQHNRHIISGEISLFG